MDLVPSPSLIEKLSVHDTARPSREAVAPDLSVVSLRLSIL